MGDRLWNGRSAAGWPLLRGTAVQVTHDFQECEFPSAHYREEGWPSDQENIAQHPLSRGRGGVPIDGTRNTTPTASIKKLRIIFFRDAATPPRGDARRGIRPFQNDTSQPHIVVLSALDELLNDFRNPNLDRCSSKEGPAD